MDHLSEQNLFGDYLPTQCIREDSFSKTWIAKQESVGRLVLIDELISSSPEDRETFLANVRAKAGVEHPLVSSIYEAYTENDFCFFTHELLPGESIEQFLQAYKKISAIHFVNLLHKIAEANIYHESHNNATSLLGPKNVFIDSQGVIRLDNLAIVGDRPSEHSIRDVVSLGTFLEDILDQNHPGTTRCLTLLSWMRGEEIESPLRWDQICNYCDQIEQQLTEPLEITYPQTSAIRPEKKKHLIWIFAAALLVLVIAFLSAPKIKKVTMPEVVEVETEWIEVKGGDYETPHKLKARVAPFLISAHEVTIGEYAKFLKTIALLSEDGNGNIFDHPDQPAEKTDHLADDWEELYSYAKRAESWRGTEINVNSPVIGVDWWDAFAYAKWKKCFIPTQQQWLAALMSGTEDPSTIHCSKWLPVTEKTTDITNHGVLGLAGSVSEWTSEAGTSPSNPLGEPTWIIIGGSFSNPSRGALTREWIENRSTRRPDLGFRVCKEMP